MNRLPFAESKSPWRGVLDLATGCYPPFLFGGGLGRWVPVFHFHEARPEALDPYFAYLAENGYRTVTSGDLAALVRRGVHPGPRSVALCFDDAWASLWIVVAPLLRRYGFRAITYVSPAHVHSASAPRPQWGEDSSAPAPDLDRSDCPFATWPELRALHASGTVDIQAHSWRHATVFCGDAPADVVRPGYRPHPHLYPWADTPGGERFLTAADLGAPLYPVRSRMSDALRFRHPAAFDAGVRHVRDNGGAAFFDRPAWRAELTDRICAAGAGRFETATERDAAIREDLGRAREVLNAELHTDTVRHMCFPFSVAGSAAVRIAGEAGYETAFADRLFGARSVRAGDDPFRLMRLKHQYLFCLPGRGRRWFFSRTPRPASAPARFPVAVPLAAQPRIALLTSSFYPVVGGGETHARLLGGAWRRQGVDVFVITRRRLPESPVFERVDDIAVHRVPPTGRPRLGKYLMLVPAYRELVRRSAEYDLIYVCGLRVLGLAGVLAALRTGKPCVLRSESRGELSGDFIWRTVDGRLLPVRRALFGWLVGLRNRLLRRADGFLAISTDIRAEYEACGVPADRIDLIVNGIDPQRFAPADAAHRAARRQELDLPAAGRIWAYSGKLNRGKGLEFLLRVWRDYVAAHPGDLLVLIGSGGNQFLSCEAELRDAVRSNALASSVRFTGYVTNVEAWLQAADAFLFPSENEALPLALLEALSCGLPAIASDVGGMRDILRDGDNGRLVAVNDAAAWRAAMETVDSDPEQAAGWGLAGRATALARFGIERVAGDHLALFRTLVDRGRKGAPA